MIPPHTCYCEPGTHVVVPCNEDSERAKCQPCPSGTFQNRKNTARSCKKCKTNCITYRHQILSGECTRFKDRECICDKGRYFSKDHDRCMNWTKCPLGQGASLNGTYLQNVECSNCTLGFFSNVSSSTEECRPCQKCAILLTKCSVYSDTVCSNSSNAADDSSQMVPLIVAGGMIVVTIIVAILIYLAWKKPRNRKQRLVDGTPGMQNTLHLLSPPMMMNGCYEQRISSSNDEETYLKETFQFLSRNLANEFHGFYLELPGDNTAWTSRENEVAYKQVRQETKEDTYKEFIIKAMKHWAEHNPQSATQLDIYRTLCSVDGLRQVQRAFEEKFPWFVLKQESSV